MNGIKTLEYKELYRLWKQEWESPSLLEIPSDLYISLDGKLSKLYSDSTSNEWPEIAELVIQRIEFLRKDLARIRLRKITDLVLSNNPISENLLTWGEKRLITNLKRSIEALGLENPYHDSENILDLEKISPNIELSIDSIEHSTINEDIEENFIDSPPKIMIRFLEDVESFVGLDNNVYGPFKKTDVTFLPQENAKALIAKLVARLVEIDKAKLNLSEQK